MKRITNIAFIGLLFLSGKAVTVEAGTVKIMPMGDSITMGGFQGSQGAWPGTPTYRYQLYRQLVDVAGWSVDFVGPNSGVTNSNNGNNFFDTTQYPGNNWDQDYTGFHGRKIDWYLTRESGQSSPRAVNLMQDYTPDIVLVHLGTNDVAGQLQSAVSAANEIGQLIDLLREGKPDVAIYISQIIPLPDGGYGGWNTPRNESQRVIDFNAALPPVIAAKNQIAGFSDVTLVDLWTGFDAGSQFEYVDLYDGTHPSLSGDIKMADAFYEALVVPVDGDFDSDTDVDGADFLKWQRDFVDASNLTLWEDNFGFSAPLTVTSATVPELNTAAIASLAIVILGVNRRRRVRIERVRATPSSEHDFTISGRDRKTE